MRDRPEYDDGRDGHLPHAKSGGLCHARKGAPRWRNRAIRAGEELRISHINPFINNFKNNAGPTPSTHSAPRVRGAAATAADVPSSVVRRHTQAVHLRAGPRATALESRPAPTAVSARVGRDADAAREPRDPGGRRAPVGQRRQRRFWPRQRVRALLVREGVVGYFACVLACRGCHYMLVFVHWTWTLYVV